MELIDKSAIVAEIENRINKYTLLQQKPEMSDLQKELQDKIDCLNSIKGYILNTLEVKEFDFENATEQNLWKPSEEQMIALRQVISGCSYDIKPLVELEAKLKEF